MLISPNPPYDNQPLGCKRSGPCLVSLRETLSAALLQNQTFIAANQQQREALTLLNSTVYIPYGGLNDDCNEYYGVVLGIPSAAPAAVQAYVSKAYKGGLWSTPGLSTDGVNIFGAAGRAQHGGWTVPTGCRSKLVCFVLGHVTFVGKLRTIISDGKERAFVSFLVLVPLVAWFWFALRVFVALQVMLWRMLL